MIKFNENGIFELEKSKNYNLTNESKVINGVSYYKLKLKNLDNEPEMYEGWITPDSEIVGNTLIGSDCMIINSKIVDSVIYDNSIINNCFVEKSDIKDCQECCTSIIYNCDVESSSIATSRLYDTSLGFASISNAQISCSVLSYTGLVEKEIFVENVKLNNVDIRTPRVYIQGPQLCTDSIDVDIAKEKDHLF